MGTTKIHLCRVNHDDWETWKRSMSLWLRITQIMTESVIYSADIYWKTYLCNPLFYMLGHSSEQANISVHIKFPFSWRDTNKQINNQVNIQNTTWIYMLWKKIERETGWKVSRKGKVMIWNSMSGKALLRRCYLSRDLKETKKLPYSYTYTHTKERKKEELPCSYLRESIPDRGNSKNKTPLGECGMPFTEEQWDQHSWKRAN